MKLLFIISCLISLGANAQTEYNELKIGADINPYTQHLTVGYKKTFTQDQILMVGSVYYSFGDTREYLVMFGMGYDFTQQIDLVLYPVWYRHYINERTYLTPITLMLEYNLPKQEQLVFEIGLTYLDYKLYTQVRLTYGFLL